MRIKQNIIAIKNMIAEKDSVLESQISGRCGERIGSNNREFNKLRIIMYLGSRKMECVYLG